MSSSEPLNPLFHEFPSVDVDEWRATVREELGDAFSEDLLTWSSLDGVSVPTYLHRRDLEDLPHVDSDARFPPLAGTDSLPTNDWQIRQTLTTPDPHIAKERARTAIEGGVTELGLEASPNGFRSKGALPSTPTELATMLDSVDLSTTGIHFENGLPGVVLYSAFREVLSTQNGPRSDLRGSIAYDPVAALSTGALGSPSNAFDLAHQLVDDAHSLSNFRPLSVDARVYHDAGASAVQEIAYTIGALSEVLVEGIERDIPLSALLESLQLIVPVSTSYFVEIAKLRALRLLVPQLLEAFAAEVQAQNDVPSTLPLQAETSRRTETIYDPYVNLLRTTTEAMAGVLGGCDILSVRPYDAALHSPAASSTRLARNTQLILKHEGHLDQVADPAAGSYYVETLTDQIAQEAWRQFQELEADGGLLAALKEGTVQEEIATTRHRREKEINERDQVLVGTTHYPALDEHRRDSHASASNGGSPPSTGHSLDSLSFPIIRSTLQEETSIPAILESLPTQKPSIEPLPRIRLAEPIESLRMNTERYADAHGDPPRVVLVPMGPVSMRSARATFARNFLGVAGFEIIEPLKFVTTEEAATQAVEAKADVVVLCSADDEYPSLAPALETALARHNHEAVLVIAGNPELLDEDLPADAFVHRHSPLQETLEHLQEQLGITGLESSPPARS